ncbi:MAG: hypothetical protein LUD47_07735 [Clostridia bacterium]|nr:hypothetical protein [Clostridia bacterium]
MSDIKFIIISRGNPLGVSTGKLLPADTEILVPETQKAEYERNLINPIVGCPAKSVGQIRNWALDNFAEETLIMFRDDITAVKSASGERASNLASQEEFLEAIHNTATMAKGARAHVFGFNELSPANYNPTEPFLFTGIADAIIGVIGRKRYFIDDDFSECMDYCMQSMMWDRIVWIDNRYYIKSGTPWNQVTDRNRDSLDKLQKDWGKYIIKKTNNKTGREVLQCKVIRRQKIEYNIWG